MDLKLDTDKIMEMAAQKIAEEVLGNAEHLHDLAHQIITAKVNEVVNDDFREKVRDRVDEALDECLNETLNRSFVPIDMWGEPKGEPTTIRAQLHQRAKDFFEEKVEADRNNTGRLKPATYGGQPRYKVVYEQIVREQFEAAMKAHVGEIVKAFRDAMRSDMGAQIGKHIESIIDSRKLPK